MTPRPADRLGPVRQALPRHALRRSAASGRDQGRADRRRPRRGPRAALGVRQPLRGRQPRPAVRQRALPRQRRRRRRPPRQRRAVCASSTAAASTARTRWSSRPTAGRSTSSPATRPTSPSSRNSLVPRVWGEDNLVRAWSTAADSWPTRRPPAAASAASAPTASVGAGLDRLPQPVRHRLQPRRRAVHLRLRHGVGRQHALVSADPRPDTPPAARSSDTATARASGRPTTIDSLPPVVNVGPGSPTGVTFGYGARFPAKYQDALYLCDWSYGKLYALHLKPKGASYTGELEEFLAGTPLALTDVVINPKDGAMYFQVGGRRTQSGFYRVTYDGGEPTAESVPVEGRDTFEARALRHELEAVPRPQGAEGHRRRAGLVPGPPRPLHPLGRPRGHRGPGPVAMARVRPGRVVEPRGGAQRPAGPDPGQRPGPGPPPQGRPARRTPHSATRSSPPSTGSPGTRSITARRLDLLRVYQVVLNRFGRPDDSRPWPG